MLRLINLSFYPQISVIDLHRCYVLRGFICLKLYSPSLSNCQTYHLRPHSGGKFSRQIGHCNLYRIHPSKHALWKICLHGVTMYALLLNSVVESAAAPPSLSPAAGTTSTSMFSVQIAQSKIFVPLSLLSPCLKADGDEGSAVA